MVSRSSKSEIIKRTKQYWKKEGLWALKNKDKAFFKINDFLVDEYNAIPEKERIGKGSVYISKAVAQGCLEYGHVSSSTMELIEYCKAMFAFSEEHDFHSLQDFSLILIAEITSQARDSLKHILNMIKDDYSKHRDWRVREMCVLTIRNGIRNYPQMTLRILQSWLPNQLDQYEKRLIIESIRPFSGVEWLRNPEKNDVILNILAQFKTDTHIYVRKSVGNNLKDLTKYMPAKILNLCKEWVKESDIDIVADLASKRKSELGKNYYLIWTLKHALRWIRKKTDKYHPTIEKILGKNYVLYFKEKGNFKAQPTT